jgi:hypothetical protein
MTSHFHATHNPHYNSSPSTIGYTYGASTPYGLPRRRKHSWAKNLPPHRQHPKSWPTPWQPKHPTSQINDHVCSPPPHQEQHKAFIAFSHTTSTLSMSSITTSAICMPSFQHNHSYILHIQATSRCLSQKNYPITLQQIRAPLGSLAMKPMINTPNLEPTNHHNVSHLQCSQAMPHPSGTLNLKHSKRIHPPFKHDNLLSRTKHCKLVQQSPHNTSPSPTTYDHHSNAQTPKSHKQLKLWYNQHMGNQRKQTMWPTKFPSPYCPLQEADMCLPPPIVQVH